MISFARLFVVKMIRELKTILLSVLLCLGCLPQASAANTTENAEPQPDSIRFSLLTCSPGPEVYALFGHSAIRYHNISRGIDCAFNYGMFSFSEPNFVMRFIKGETDYQLGITSFEHFKESYAARGSYVVEQELNLTSAEKLHLLALLEENFRPENRVYRYNYFYDNCTTRARDKIEESIEGTVIYPEKHQNTSYRKIIHHYTQGHEWAELGIDFCLGKTADDSISYRAQMFAPFVLVEAMDNAQIVNADGSKRPLVKSRQLVVNPIKAETASDLLPTPMTLAVILLIAVTLCCAWELKRKRYLWGVSALLFGGQGIAGCIVAFLFFFSIHPTVDSNYLVIIFNPIPLLYLPWMIYKACKRKMDYYHWANAWVLTLFIVFWWAIPQKFNPVVLPLTAILLIKSLTYIIICRKPHP